MIDGKMIKVCGMTLPQNIKEVEDIGIDLMGFIFYPKSPRCIKGKPEYLPSKVKRVGVFVNVPIEEILIQDTRFHFDYIQLHGKESPEYCGELKGYGFKIIKAFSIENEEDMITVKGYNGLCEMYLFDTKTVSVGGSGNAFDWRLLQSYNEDTPFLLSGGLSIENIEQIKEFKHDKLAGYDLNSRFETAPGVKDTDKLRTFISKIYE